MKQHKQNIINCMEHIKQLQTQEMFLLTFYEEMITGRVNDTILENPFLMMRYHYFKQQYLMEMATSRALIEQQYYLNTLNTNRNPEYVLEVA